MNPHIKKIVKILPVFNVIICIITLIVSFFIKDVPVVKTYTYEDNRIITHSWYDIYLSVLAIIFFIIVLSALVCISVRIIEKIKTKKKILRQIRNIFLNFLLCSFIMILGDNLVTGAIIYDYSPEYYKFSDNRHTIVIEEKSYLLYGGGTIYQIKNNNEAVIIHTFTTDDGGRNHGRYDINWHDDYAEITYNTFYSEDSKRTEKISFAS